MDRKHRSIGIACFAGWWSGPDVKTVAYDTWRIVSLLDDRAQLELNLMGDGPFCSLRFSTLDSLDYWMDDALMPVVHPTSAMEWQRWNRIRLEKHVSQMFKKTRMRRSLE